MDADLFDSLSLYLGVGALMAFMLFIVWDLAKESKAGKFGTAILFIVLGLCLLGFIIKAVLVQVIE